MTQKTPDLPPYVKPGTTFQKVEQGDLHNLYPQTTPAEEVAAIQKLIDACCFTSNETTLRLKDKAEDALESLKVRLDVRY
jgi:hypothetical protein